MFYTYVIESLKNAQWYIGFTADLRKRLEEHNQGLNFSTKRYRPWKCVYYEACIDKDDAFRRERYLKTTQGGRLLKRRVKEYLYKKNLTD
ncbi:MAG: GIY-YIG nuclease family protein [Candidatus Pacebacteria bacterium]|nr:GIY-YIG nuclease family protein [Candidatus Paceibacterota bacterium]MDD5357303.1 GIY-YIG nuclease family protein [Candidatus Paceibacterota bacterium]